MALRRKADRGAVIPAPLLYFDTRRLGTFGLLLPLSFYKDEYAYGAARACSPEAMRAADTTVAAYVCEIASRTEQYWCPIKHALKVTSPHKRYQAFADYGDAEGYRNRLGRLREALRAKDAARADVG